MTESAILSGICAEEILKLGKDFVMYIELKLFYERE